MKISLITACYNSAKTIKTAIDSVLSQKGVEIEYIVVDGGSKDGTVDLLKSYEPKFNGWMRWISEPDKGMYDAINKGIKMATGDIVGILNADKNEIFSRLLLRVAGWIVYNVRRWRVIC
jgi:glycosyltransferase involved in cell wall biosynthesis